MLSSPAPSLSPESSTQALAGACRALWLATLSLMTAYMNQPAPAHRLLLARRIARNLHTLAGQECFEAGCRAKFDRLAAKWEAKGEEKQPGCHPILRSALQHLL